MSRRSWVEFVAVSVLWGTPFFFIKIAIPDVSTPVITASRLAIAALVLLPFAFRRRSLGPALAKWPWVVALGLGYLALGQLGVSEAELFVSSSMVPVVLAASPIAVVAFSLTWYRPRPLEWFGLFLGLVGVAVLVGVDVQAGLREVIGVAILIVVAISYALAPIVSSRKLPGLDPIGYMALALALGAIALVPAAAVTLPEHVPSAHAAWAIVALGIIGTALPTGLFFGLVERIGPQRATLMAYISPAVAVCLGVGLLGERMTWSAIAGMALVLVGSWIGGQMGNQPVGEPRQQTAEAGATARARAVNERQA